MVCGLGRCVVCGAGWMSCLSDWMDEWFVGLVDEWFVGLA